MESVYELLYRILFIYYYKSLSYEIHSIFIPRDVFLIEYVILSMFWTICESFTLYHFLTKVTGISSYYKLYNICMYTFFYNNMFYKQNLRIIYLSGW